MLPAGAPGEPIFVFNSRDRIVCLKLGQRLVIGGQCVWYVSLRNTGERDSSLQKGDTHQDFVLDPSRILKQQRSQSFSQSMQGVNRRLL
jgi:hypothetical protein